jgi:tetratricopeptide (TPR) repeat protein
MMAAGLHIKLREPEAAERIATRTLALCEEFGTPALAAVCRATLGRAMADLGRAAEGVALLRDAAKVLDESVTRLSITENLSWLAEALALDGKIDDALGVIEDALRANPNGLVNRPEAFRVRGQLRLKIGQPELAEADFREAIALSQRIGAKMLELRATASLAQLLDRQGKRDEARTMLADIYNWFTEGFDTADLKDAKALLNELAG